MLRAADLTPELVDAATEALLMSHRKFSETRLEAMRFTVDDRAGQAVHGRYDDVVAAADVPDERLQLRAVGSALAGLLLGEGLVALPHRLELPGEVLAGRRHPEIRNTLPRGPMCSIHV